MNVTVFTLLAAVVLLSSFVQGVIGIGFALISAPVISLLVPALLPATVLLRIVPLTALVASHERQASAPADRPTRR